MRVFTEDGLDGLGETWFGTAAVEADIHNRIAPALLGQNARRIGALTQQMLPYTGRVGTSAEMRALSAVEVALWDLAGKRTGLALCDLLGGRVRDSIPVYNTCAGPDYVSKSSDVRPENFGQADAGYEDLTAFMERPADLAAGLWEMGIRSMKIWPFDFADGARHGMDISAADLRAGLAPFEAIRTKFPDMGLKAELHGLWSLPAARKICTALEPIGVDWVEDPIWMDRPDQLQDLKSSTRCPIAGGETLGGLGQIGDLLTRGQIDYPIVDVTWGGGIGFARKAAAIAEAHARPIAFHDCSGPVTLAASSHLAMALDNVREQEMTRAFYFGWYGKRVDGLPELADGSIKVSDAPGHGVHLKPETLANAVSQTRSTAP